MINHADQHRLERRPPPRGHAPLRRTVEALGRRGGAAGIRPGEGSGTARRGLPGPPASRGIAVARRTPARESERAAPQRSGPRVTSFVLDTSVAVAWYLP